MAVNSSDVVEATTPKFKVGDRISWIGSPEVVARNSIGTIVSVVQKGSKLKVKFDDSKQTKICGSANIKWISEDDESVNAAKERGAVGKEKTEKGKLDDIESDSFITNDDEAAFDADFDHGSTDDFAGQDADFKNDFDLAQSNETEFNSATSDGFDDEVGKDFAPPGKNDFSETGFGDDTAPVVVSPENVKGADDVDSFNQNDKATVQKDNEGDLPSVGDADFEVAGEAGFFDDADVATENNEDELGGTQGWGSADGEDFDGFEDGVTADDFENDNDGQLSNFEDDSKDASEADGWSDMKGEGFDDFEDLASTDTFHDSDGVSGQNEKDDDKDDDGNGNDDIGDTEEGGNLKDEGLNDFEPEVVEEELANSADPLATKDGDTIEEANRYDKPRKVDVASEKADGAPTKSEGEACQEEAEGLESGSTANLNSTGKRQMLKVQVISMMHKTTQMKIRLLKRKDGRMTLVRTLEMERTPLTLLETRR